jgi:hypothetical protein
VTEEGNGWGTGALGGRGLVDGDGSARLLSRSRACSRAFEFARVLALLNCAHPHLPGRRRYGWIGNGSSRWLCAFGSVGAGWFPVGWIALGFGDSVREVNVSFSGRLD